MSDSRHRSHMGKTAPHLIADTQVSAMQRSAFTTVKPFRKIIRCPEIQISHLWAVDTDDTEKIPGRNSKGFGISRPYNHLFT